MKATTFDALEIAEKLKETGVPEDQAKVIAQGMREAAVADRDDLATKGDISDLRGDIRAVRGEIRALEAATKGDIGRLEGKIEAIKTDIGWLRWVLYFVVGLGITIVIGMGQLLYTTWTLLERTGG